MGMSHQVPWYFLTLASIYELYDIREVALCVFHDMSRNLEISQNRISLLRD